MARSKKSFNIYGHMGNPDNVNDPGFNDIEDQMGTLPIASIALTDVIACATKLNM